MYHIETQPKEVLKVIETVLSISKYINQNTCVCKNMVSRQASHFLLSSFHTGPQKLADYVIVTSDPFMSFEFVYLRQFDIGSDIYANVS